MNNTLRDEVEALASELTNQAGDYPDSMSLSKLSAAKSIRRILARHPDPGDSIVVPRDRPAAPPPPTT